MLVWESRISTPGCWRRGCARSIAALLFALPASAEDLATPGADADEISITGQDESAPGDGAESSTPFRPSERFALRIEDFADLADYVPNLEIDTSFAASNPTVYIRGLGLKDEIADVEGSIAVYQDGVNINSPAIHLGQIFDVERIDVLRGPQGSVNAHNATAGALMIRAARPDGDFGVSTNLSYGNYDAKEVEAAIDIPLIADMLSMRVSGIAQWRDGYTKNQCAGWNPAQYGAPDPNQGPTTELYNSLGPLTQHDAMGNVTRARLARLRGGIVDTPAGNGEAMIFADWEAARDASNTVADASIGWGSARNPTVLAEDLLDENGNVVIYDGTPMVAGTPVGFMRPSFKIEETAVDGICYMKSPGILSTLESEFADPANPLAANEHWTRDSLQPDENVFKGLDRWTNDVDQWAARTVLLFEPLDNMEWMFNVHGSQNRSDSAHLQMIAARALFEGGFAESKQAGFSENNAQFQAKLLGGPALGEGYRDVAGVQDQLPAPGQAGGNPFSGFYDQDGTERVDAWGVNGHGLLDLGRIVVTLLYDYEWYDRVVESEGDATPLRINPAVFSDSAWQTTTDLRIEGGGERYQWTLGFFFLYEELRANNLYPDTQLFETNQDFAQDLTSLAPYLAGEVDLFEEGAIPGVHALTLRGGVRYNYEKKEFSLSSSVVGTTSIPVAGIALREIEEKKTWEEPTGDVQLTYTPFSNASGSLAAYLRYGRGFKSGNFNEGLTIRGGDPVQTLDPVKSEINDAVEFGIRTRWFDDRVFFNAAVFRYWYQDLQVFDIANEPGKLPTRKLLNSDADVLGAEAELHLRPLPGLSISANLGWLDTEFDDFTVVKTIQTPRNPSPQPVPFDYSGNHLVGAPEWNWSGIAEYEIPLFGWGFLIPHYDVNYRSKTYFDPQMLDPISQDGYWLHNARIAYRTPGERIELAFWVRNLFKEEYKLDAYDQSRQAASILELWAVPRTYGATLSLNW